MNIQDLPTLTLVDLRKMAAQYSIRVHPRHSAESIATMIKEQIMKPANMQHVAERPKAPTHISTENEVNEAIKGFVEKKGLEVVYPGDDTCIFKCKGAEESVHLSTPLRVIKMKAETVSHGARKPRVVKFDGELILSV